MTDTRLRHLTSVRDLDRVLALRILHTAEAFLEVTRRPVRKVPTLRGKTIINAFFEASTRTRTSFELAGKRLGADVVNIGGSASSTSTPSMPASRARRANAVMPIRTIGLA
mgnify:CR=1 FL=1